jgi:Tol biopolymer transport system component
MSVSKLLAVSTVVAAAGLTACASSTNEPLETGVTVVRPASTDFSLVTPKKADPREMPSWQIPNFPEAAEAYYAPNSYHVILQTQDSDALKASHEKAAGGALTWITTDDGKEKWRANDHGQDACSYFMPDGKRIVYTSTRDNMDMPIGNWSSEDDYPQGAELYISNMDGSDVVRLTDNEYYDAEVSVSPDGSKIIFTRQINGELDVWLMNSDGTDEHQITFTPDYQEGAPFFLADNKTITLRAWKHSEYGKISPTPMTIFAIDTDKTYDTAALEANTAAGTDDGWMNWAPYPAPDGRHYVFVRPLKENPRNWEVYMGDLEGGEPVRLTFNDKFDGFPSISPDGKKMLWARSMGDHFMGDLYTFVMDISSLNVGPK